MELLRNDEGLSEELIQRAMRLVQAELAPLRLRELDWKSSYHDLVMKVRDFDATLRGQRGIGWKAVKEAREAMTAEANAGFLKLLPADDDGVVLAKSSSVDGMAAERDSCCDGRVPMTESETKVAAAAADVMQSQLQTIAELEADNRELRRELNEMKCCGALAKPAESPHTVSNASTEAHRRTDDEYPEEIQRR